jgi:hypothetical protein
MAAGGVGEPVAELKELEDYGFILPEPAIVVNW